MKPQAFVDLVERVRYKPGWVLSACCGGRIIAGEVHFHLEHATLDAKDGVTPTSVILGEYLTGETVGAFSLSDAISWIGYQIRRAEMHEMDEYFKIDGQHVNEPHPELLSTPHFKPGQ